MLPSGSLQGQMIDLERGKTNMLLTIALPETSSPADTLVAYWRAAETVTGIFDDKGHPTTVVVTSFTAHELTVGCTPPVADPQALVALLGIKAEEAARADHTPAPETGATRDFF